MTDNEQQAALHHNDPEWEPAKELVRSRLAAMLALAGQGGKAPFLSFNPSSTYLGSDMSTPASYGGLLSMDRVCVNLPGLFESPASVASARVPVLDGFLLHELGHRRRRYSLMLCVDVVGPGLATMASLVVYLLARGFGIVDSADALAWLAVVWALLWVVWLVVRRPVARWHERQADDCVADVGGRERWDAFVAGLAHVGSVPTAVHASVPDRNARQQRRLAGRDGREQ